MLEFDNLKKSLEVFRDAVIAEAKQNLKRQDKISSGGLYDSIKGSEVVVYPSGALEFEITMPLYGFFVDKGVRGANAYYADKATSQSPYKYTNKMPPPSALDKWIVRKGLGRGPGGKFAKRKSLQFAIAKSIFDKGIKASLFFTKPFEKHYKNLPPILAQAYGLDAEGLMRGQFIRARQKAK